MKYPIELELTDHCSLTCDCCPNKTYINKGFISDHVFYNTIDYIYENRDNIFMLDLCGVGDIFLHPNICIYLEYIGKKLSDTDINILIPTKGTIINSHHIQALKSLTYTNLNFNISVGFYSMREKIHDKLSGRENYKIMMNFISTCLKENIPLGLELLINKFSIKELEYFYDFGKKIGVNYKVHTFHNFGGSMTDTNIYSYDTNKYKIDCELAGEDTYMTNFYCKYVMLFLAQDGYLFSCSHGGKQEKYRTELYTSEKGEGLFQQFPDFKDLVHYITQNRLNKLKCKDCTYFQPEN